MIQLAHILLSPLMILLGVTGAMHGCVEAVEVSCNVLINIVPPGSVYNVLMYVVPAGRV
jgi:hypothetical protein